MFCITKKCFSLLHQRIISSIGEHIFKLELYIDTFLKVKYSKYDAYSSTSGVFVAGKVNIAIIVYILAGGGYLDLTAIFDISLTCYLLMLYEVLHYWIIDIDIRDTCIDSYLYDKEAVAKASAGVS